MTALDVTTSFAQTLVDEWARNGIRHAVVAPGSRNTPLTLALARHRDIALDMVLDERSAAFRALGIARSSGRPVIVGCTSGTAAANFLPAVIEASQRGVPLIVCTADRPPELQDWGAPQTVDQRALYGTAVRWFHEPGPPHASEGAGAVWRALACRAVAEATGSRPGPVHLNLAFREPLVPTGEPLLDAPGRPDGQPFVVTTRAEARIDASELASWVRANPRGVVVAGDGAAVRDDTLARVVAATGWPVLADAISGCRNGSGAISTYEALLRVPEFAGEHLPTAALRVGAPLTSKVANAWLERVPHAVVADDDTWRDPARTAGRRVVGDADTVLSALADALGEPSEPAWLQAWVAADKRVRAAIDRVLDNADATSEGRIARDLAAALPAGAALVVASSLPVRALEWCMAPRDGIALYANRGANGIDGFVSTAGGIARGRAHGPTVALCGDLCFLHDTNGLLTLDHDRDITFVVIDNRGGGIFSYLPQHELAEFEALFATPQDCDIVAVARAHGIPAERVKGPALPPVDRAGTGPRVLVVEADREAALAVHRRLWEAAATELSD